MNTKFYYRLHGAPRIQLHQTYYNKKKKKRHLILNAPIHVVSDTLTFSETIVAHKLVTASISQTVTFVSTTTDSDIRFVNDSLTFSEVVTDFRLIAETISDTITFSGVIETSDIKVVLDTLSLTETLHVEEHLFENFSQTLTFNQTINSENIKFVSDFLVLDSRNILARAFKKTVSQTLVFTEFFTVNVKPAQHISQILSFGLETLVIDAPAFHGRAENLVFTEESRTTNIFSRSVDDTLTFTEDNTFLKAKPRSVSQTFAFSQTLAKKQVLHQTIAQTLVFTQTPGLKTVLHFGFHDTLTFLSPFYVGTQLNGRIFTRYAVEYVLVPRRCSVILQSTTSNDSIVLPCPNFDDTEGNLAELSPIKKTMRGTSYTYIKRSNAKKIKYVIDMDTQKALQLRRFLFVNQSLPVRMTNWKGEAWYSFITNNPVDMVYKGRRSPRDEEVEVQLEFEGYLMLG